MTLELQLDYDFTTMTYSNSKQITRIILVRHGQSVANAGGTPPDHITNPLTELGHAQAKAFSEGVDCSPTLFLVSPFLRARQTAEPLRRRFPEIPVEEWPIHEFTFLEPSRHSGTNEEQQMPHITEYWERGDPAYLTGPGAESFTLFLDRAREASGRLAQMAPGGCIVVFTHGLLMQAFRLLSLFPKATDAQLMANFRRFHFLHFITNTESLELEVVDGELWLVGQDRLAAFTLQ
jgi:2,3-bisphosphoglycerate-dependent phosphoglycerate mutase